MSYALYCGHCHDMVDLPETDEEAFAHEHHAHLQPGENIEVIEFQDAPGKALN